MPPRESWQVVAVDVDAPTSGVVVRAVHLVPSSASAHAAVVRREARGAPAGSLAAGALRRLERAELAAAMGVRELPVVTRRPYPAPPPLRAPPPLLELAEPRAPAPSTPATRAAAAALPALIEAVRQGDDTALREALCPVGEALRGSRGGGSQ